MHIQGSWLERWLDGLDTGRPARAVLAILILLVILVIRARWNRLGTGEKTT